MDRLEEWRLFVGVATQRSFAKAAKAAGKSPQAATRAVAALEARLGTRLIHRTTRSVTLTNDGERTLAEARGALAAMDALEKREEGDLHGVIAITAPLLFGQLHVLPIVTEFLAAHPALDVKLLLVDRVVSLAEEGIDAGVRIGALPDSSLRARLVGHVRTVCVASPAYLERAGRPRTLEALAKHDGIVFLEPWTKRARIRPRLTTASGAAAIDAALAGVGILRALSYQVAAHVEAGRLVPILRAHDSEPVPVHLVQLSGRTSRAAAAFVDLADERLRPVLFRGA